MVAEQPAGRRSDPSAARLSRESRQMLAGQAVVSLCAVLRNARSHAEDNAVFAPALQQLSDAMHELLAEEGLFELQVAQGAALVNREPVRLDAGLQPLVEALQQELQQRGLSGLRALLAPSREELRNLVYLFSPGATQAPGPRGDPKRPLKVIELLPREVKPHLAGGPDLGGALLQAYGHAVFFVDRTIAQLRSAGETIPTWAASRVVQDLVDLQKVAPVRFLQLSRAKSEDEYWGQHAANVAVLSITFGARLGLSKARRHDLGMAALLHDVGVAALPSALLAKSEPLSEREMVAVKSSPLFAARAILRDREVHHAALERAMAAYECHLDLVPLPGEPLPEIGLAGRVIALCEAFDALTTERPFRPARGKQEALRVIRTELVFRFDPLMLDLFPTVIEQLD